MKRLHDVFLKETNLKIVFALINVSKKHYKYTHTSINQHFEAYRKATKISTFIKDL